MSIFTTTGKYDRGIVKPLAKPRFKIPDEVIITFVKYEDADEQIFKMIEPQYRNVRRQVFKEQFPKLYEKYYGKKNKTNS